jgi:serine/threonine-protein kinase
MNTRYSGKTYVGSGGMASVYRAFDEVLRRTVAIKELTEQLRGNADVRSLFLKEARKMAAVRHQNVVQVYDVSDEGDIPTIIMEYLEGGSIASKLGRGPLTPD